jgi:hypothetical protein
MANETVSLARAAWQRLKKDRGSWSDWIIVGGALLEGRAAAMRNARAVQPLGTGYGQALGTWMLDNRLTLRPWERAALLTVMENLPAIEAWLATLPPLRRARMNCPTTVVKHYRKAIGTRTGEHVIPPSVSATP